MPQMQTNRPQPQGGQTYIKPLAKSKMAASGRILVLLTVVLLLSLTVLVGMVAAMRARVAERRAAIVALESQIAEQRILLSIAAAEATVPPIEEPKLDHASESEQTKVITDIDSGYAILIDMDKNEIVAAKNGDARIYPASMTKVMTLIVAVEHIADLTDTFTFDYTVTDPAYKAGASVAGFLAGETVSMLDILYGAALPSGADATTALALTVGGTEEVFAELMNKKAEEIGLTETHFMNASGLHHPEHYSTPHEMAMIMEYAMDIPLLREILGTYKYTTAPTAQHPEGLLLVDTMYSRMYGDEAGNCEVIAGKTGYTPEAGQCLASVARTPDGREFVLVTASAVGKYAPIYDAIDIYKNYIPAISD